MNSKTAKFLRRAALMSSLTHRQMKKKWNNTPRNKRHAVRLELEQKMREHAG